MQIFNLKEMQHLDPMQFQLLDKISLRNRDLIFEYNNLYFDKRLYKKKYYEEHKKYKRCVISFRNAQNTVVELIEAVDENTIITLKWLIIKDFIGMYCGENGKIETLRMFCDSRAVIVKGNLIIPKQEAKTCTFIIPASEVSYDLE